MTLTMKVKKDMPLNEAMMKIHHIIERTGSCASLKLFFRNKLQVANTWHSRLKRHPDIEKRHKLRNKLGVSWPGCSSHQIPISVASSYRIRFQPCCTSQDHIKFHSRVCSVILWLVYTISTSIYARYARALKIKIYCML